MSGVALAACALVSGIASAAEPPRGEWHLDSYCAGGAPCTEPDSSANGNGAVWVGNTFSPVGDGRFGGAYAFPAETSYLDAGNAPVLQPSRVSLVAWVRAPSAPSAVKIVASQGSNGGCSYSSYAIYTGGSAPGAGGLRFYVTTDAGGGVSPPAPTTIWDNQWHMIAGTYDGSAVHLYVDGVDVGSTPVTGNIRYGLAQSNDFTIGGSTDYAACFENMNFSGDIDETRVYGRALTADEVNTLASTPGPSPPELPGDSVPPPPPPPPPPPTVARNITPPVVEQTSLPGGKFLYKCSDGTWEGLADQPNFVHQIWESTLFDGAKLVAGGGVILKKDARKRVYFCKVTAATATGGTITATGDGLLVPDSRISLPLRLKSAGDPRIRGIDVFQVVQPMSGAGMFGYPGVSGFPAVCGGGTPTSLMLPDCAWVGKASQTTAYNGVTLDAGKRTSAFVYLDRDTYSSLDSSMRDLPLVVRLHGYAKGRLDATLTQTVTAGSLSALPYTPVTDIQRAQSGLQFDIPSSWLEAVAAGANGTFDLDASVSIQPGHPDAEQCAQSTIVTVLPATTTCRDNDTYNLTGVRARHFNFEPVIRMVAMLRPDQTLTSLHGASSVLQRTRDLFPGGESFHVSDYAATIRMDPYQFTADSENCPKPKDKAGNLIAEDTAAVQARVRACRNGYVASMLRAWAYAPRQPSEMVSRTHGYNILVGVHSYDSGDGKNEGGVKFQGDVSGMKDPGNQPWIHIDDGTREWPLKAAGHEMGHAFGAVHAGIHYGGIVVGDPSCGGDLNGQVGEPWPPADSGRLEGIAFDAGTGKRAVDLDAPDTYGRPLFDLMSYCADDGNSWLSARNWNQFVQAMGKLGDGIPFRRAALRVATVKDTGYVTGSLLFPGARIEHIEPAQKGIEVPAADPGSTTRIRAYDAGGNLIDDIGAHTELNHNGGGGTFVAPLPGATKRVELVEDGQVVEERAAGIAPKLTLTAPKRGAHARKALDVRWTATDPDSDDLTATVDFSAGRNQWKTLYYGASTGRATLPAALLQASTRARLRVRVTDGFGVAAATSAPFRSDGTPPQAQIVRPAGTERLQAGQRVVLVGQATDDADRQLTGKRVRWFAGAKRLGTGARLSTRLPAGTVKLRMVAVDAHGRRATATRTLHAPPPPLSLTKLRAANVKAGARRAAVTIAASRAAVLQAGGRRYAIGPQAHRITVRLPKQPALGIVRVPLRLKPRGGRSGTATLIVLRG